VIRESVRNPGSTGSTGSSCYIAWSQRYDLSRHARLKLDLSRAIGCLVILLRILVTVRKRLGGCSV